STIDSKSEAKDLPCFFAIFAQEHKNSSLLKYIEKCREEKWRNASATAATKRITEMAKYFSELTPYLDSMRNYSLCEGHYNWVVAKKNFINQLEKGTDSILLSLDEPEKKKLKFSNDDDDLQVLEKTFVDVDIQVDLCEKTFVDFVSFLDPMCEILQRRIDELEKNNKQLLSENETLKKRLSERFTNQKDRILS
ncbi:19049_t:CDS:2, partial [Racocetra persica]